MILTTVCLLVLCACQPDYSNGKKPAAMRTVEIEGCEYLEYDSGRADQRVYSLTHKGNCKNPIHKLMKP